MRNHIRKFGRSGGRGRVVHILALATLVSLAAAVAPAAATTDPGAPCAPCVIQRATLDESGQPTPEISTEQMAKIAESQSTLVFDARPHEEFGMSHIPGAINVGPKPGMKMSQYTSDVAEIDSLTHGDKARAMVLYCNGPLCGKSKRLAQDLLKAGYTNVSRYQLGIPVWRALGHPAQAEASAIWSALAKDKTAVVIDAREPEAFRKRTLPNARNVLAPDVAKAKDDGRLPMLDHNTRIFVVGKDEGEARDAAQEIAHNAFQNVAYYAGSVEELLKSRPRQTSR